MNSILNWAKSKNNYDTFSWIEQRKLKTIKKISKCCFYCNKPIRWFHITKGLCGSFDYVRAHRRCVKNHQTKQITNAINSRRC